MLLFFVLWALLLPYALLVGDYLEWRLFVNAAKPSDLATDAKR
jgi:hypothetical protein